MKKVLVCLMLFLSYGFSNEDLFIRNSIKINDNHVILLLSDNRLVELYPVGIRDQTWSEWWHSTKVEEPEKAFLCDFSKWSLSTSVKIGEQDWKTYTEEMVAKYSNKEITKCNFIIENRKTNECAFARLIEINDLIVIILKIAQEKFNEGYKTGEDSGYWRGYAVGYSCANN